MNFHQAQEQLHFTVALYCRSFIRVAISTEKNDPSIFIRRHTFAKVSTVWLLNTFNTYFYIPVWRLLFETNNEKFSLRRVKSKKICGHLGGNVLQSSLALLIKLSNFINTRAAKKHYYSPLLNAPSCVLGQNVQRLFRLLPNSKTDHSSSHVHMLYRITSMLYTKVDKHAIAAYA